MKLKLNVNYYGFSDNQCVFFFAFQFRLLELCMCSCHGFSPGCIFVSVC
jgi:hypothetical protein